MSENTCHISVLMNSTSENTSSSGIARVSADSAAVNPSGSWRAAQRTMNTSPKPTTR